jgi:predicted metal-dependent HD superfamily phosphohydrolase
MNHLNLYENFENNYLIDNINILNILNKYNIQITIDEIEQRYSESHRYYHTLTHINFIIKKIHELKLSIIQKEILFISAIFHDIIYIIDSKTNEIDSNNFFLEKCKHTNFIISNVSILILDTEKHIPSNYLSKIFCDLDMYNIKYNNYEKLLIDEELIRKEYSKYDDIIYKKGRISFLYNMLKTYGKSNSENIEKLINYINKIY